MDSRVQELLALSRDDVLTMDSEGLKPALRWGARCGLALMWHEHPAHDLPWDKKAPDDWRGRRSYNKNDCLLGSPSASSAFGRV